MARLGTTGGSNALRTSSGASIISAATYVSLHTADPGTTGASEATGGSPAYARKAITWGTPTFSSGTETVSSAATITFDVPAGTYAYFGLWDALAGNYLMGGTCTSQTFSGQGQYQISSGQLSVTATA